MSFIDYGRFEGLWLLDKGCNDICLISRLPNRGSTLDARNSTERCCSSRHEHPPDSKIRNINYLVEYL